MRPSRDARLVFVISNDYGELSNALYFLQGQALASRATLLLPPRVYAVNKDRLPVPVVEYTTAGEVVEIVRRIEPAVVFLFSGYLYTINELFSVESLEMLIQFLREKGCRVVTSDPFLGALSRAESAAELGAIHKPFLRTFDVLREEMHFTPTPCDQLGDGIARFSVYNPRSMRTRGEASGKPFWLFTLSAEDYRFQIKQHGARRFNESAVEKVTSALGQGRRAVFIGPPDCIALMSAEVSAESGVTLQSFCSHDEFTSLLVEAEYAFYWNLFSNSLVVRLGNGLPTFFFDRGHLATVFLKMGHAGSMYSIAVRNYFLGWRPICLDQRQELAEPVLALLSRIFEPNRRAIQENCRRAPSPEEALAVLIAGRS